MLGAPLAFGDVPTTIDPGMLALGSTGSEGWRGNLARDEAACSWEGIHHQQMEAGLSIAEPPTLRRLP